MVRICLICGFREVVEVAPITCSIIKPLGVTSTLLLYCHAMLVDVDLGLRDIHDRCEIVNNGLPKVATKTHIWVD